MTTKIILIFWYGFSFGSLLLQANLLERVFPSKFFAIEAYVYGFLASFLFAIAYIINNLRKFDESKGATGGISKIGYILLAVQPFGGGLLAFLAVPIGKVVSSNLGQGYTILVGLTVGFFFTYLTETVFMKKVFKKYIDDKFLKGGSEQ